jgi:hypothetical protein
MTAAAGPEIGRRFQLHREEDVTGVSGVGVVADGCAWADGTAVVHWRGEHRSTVVWAGPDGLTSVEAVHGHEGRTRVVFID